MGLLFSGQDFPHCLDSRLAPGLEQFAHTRSVAPSCRTAHVHAYFHSCSSDTPHTSCGSARFLLLHGPLCTVAPTLSHLLSRAPHTPRGPADHLDADFATTPFASLRTSPRSRFQFGDGLLPHRPLDPRLRTLCVCGPHALPYGSAHIPGLGRLPHFAVCGLHVPWASHSHSFLSLRFWDCTYSSGPRLFIAVHFTGHESSAPGLLWFSVWVCTCISVHVSFALHCTRCHHTAVSRSSFTSPHVWSAVGHFAFMFLISPSLRAYAFTPPPATFTPFPHGPVPSASAYTVFAQLLRLVFLGSHRGSRGLPCLHRLHTTWTYHTILDFHLH